jgi:hypothetical protein
MLENLKLISDMKHHTPYHQFIQLNYSNADHLHRFIAKIITVKPQLQENASDNGPFSHLQELEE